MKPQEIKSVRVGLRMTQEQFGMRVGVTRRTVLRWEIGLSVPHRIFIGRIQDVRDGKR